MKTGRDKKIAEEIRREVSQIFTFELNDPRAYGATVTRVQMTPDLKLARVYFALPGAAERGSEAQKALNKSAGFVRRLLAERIRIKFLPQLEFFYDESLEIEGRLEKLFEQIKSHGRDDGGDPSGR